MKRWLVKNSFIKAIGTFIVLSIIIIGISVYFLYDEALIGPAYLLAGIFSLGVAVKFYGIKVEAMYPDIVFGIIDNGILIFATILGGSVAGINGAVLGGAAGNTLTDGVGGLFEGRIAEKLKRDNFEEERDSLSTMIGKVIGCLFGAGGGLIVAWGFKVIYTGMFLG